MAHLIEEAVVSIGGDFVKPMLDADHPAVQVLRSFLAEMYQWETDLIRQDSAIEWGNTTREAIAPIYREARKQRERIYEKYCDKGTQARRLRDEGLAWSRLITYDPNETQIIAVTEKRGVVVIETYRGNVAFKYRRFGVISVDGEWRVRDMCEYSIKGDRWSREPL